MNGKMKEGLPPLLCEKPRILILGTFPGEKSLDKMEYYSDPRNRFWKIIAALFSPLPYTDLCLNSFEDKKELLKQAHIALWDVYSVVKRKGSLDRNIVDRIEIDCQSLIKILRENPSIEKIAFNGDEAKKTYAEGYQNKIQAAFPKRNISLAELPSSSNSNRRYNDVSKLIEKWFEQFSITGLDAVWGDKPKTLILGTFPGKESLNSKEYYSNSKNRFWDLVGYDKDPEDYNQKIKFLDNKRIALWDIYERVIRDGSSDKGFAKGSYNNVFERIKNHPSIKTIILTGVSENAKAHYLGFIRHFHKEIEDAKKERKLQIFLLPSTSPQNGNTDGLIAKWNQFFPKKER